MRFFLFKVHGYTFYSAPLHARSVRYLAIISIACRIRIEIGFGRNACRGRASLCLTTNYFP